MTQPWILLGTSGCHLCDDAKRQIEALGQSLSVTIPLYERDISESAELVEHFGLRIPVLLNPNRGEELDWPFDPERLTDWVLPLLAPGCDQ
jgi:hypothetical protein